MFEFKAVPLVPLVAECLERHQSRAQAKNQQLRVEPPPADKVTEGAPSPVELPSSHPATLSPCHLRVWADEEAVPQILDNLVDNAVKYVPEHGRITVRWRAEGEAVCLEVEDTGIGIPEQDLPRIFERFYRVDKARSRQLGGTGLGLSIVKHLVQALHGTVRAASRPGQGTTFHVRLRQAQAHLARQGAGL